MRRTVGRRATWLGINLLTAFAAAAVINVFEETIVKVVALAVLMPIVASMGGITGTQTLTLAIRGRALGQLNRRNILWMLNRKFLIAALNGLILATLVVITASLLFDDRPLGWVIATAMMITILVAAIAGSLPPGLLRNLGIDCHSRRSGPDHHHRRCKFFVFLGLASPVYA